MSHSAYFRNEIRFIALIFHFCAHQMRMMYAFSIQERMLNAHRIEKSSMNTQDELMIGSWMRRKREKIRVKDV